MSHEDPRDELRVLLAEPHPSPFSDAEHAAMRRNVLAEIERRTAAPSFWPFLLRFAAAGLAVAVLGFLLLRTAGRRESPQLPVAQKPAAPMALPTPVPTPGLVAAAAVRVAAAPVAPRPVARIARRSRPSAPVPETPMRIEIQTSNPAIRIIWVVNSSTPATTPGLVEGS